MWVQCILLGLLCWTSTSPNVTTTHAFVSMCRYRHRHTHTHRLKLTESSPSCSDALPAWQSLFPNRLQKPVESPSPSPYHSPFPFPFPSPSTPTRPPKSRLVRVSPAEEIAQLERELATQFGLKGASKHTESEIKTQRDSQPYEGKIPKKYLSVRDGKYRGFDPTYSQIRAEFGTAGGSDTNEHSAFDDDDDDDDDDADNVVDDDDDAESFDITDDEELEYDDEYDDYRSDNTSDENYEVNENMPKSDDLRFHDYAEEYKYSSNAKDKEQQRLSVQQQPNSPTNAKASFRLRPPPPSLPLPELSETPKRLTKHQKAAQLKEIGRQIQREQAKGPTSQDYFSFDFVEYQDANQENMELNNTGTGYSDDFKQVIFEEIGDSVINSADHNPNKDGGGAINKLDSAGRQIILPPSKQIFTAATFSQIGVTNLIVLQNLEKNMSVINPTRIQSLAIPIMIHGRGATNGSDVSRNVVIHAQTGSGKTLAYLLPLIDIIDSQSSRVQAIILAPSRELVHQIVKVANVVFEGTDLRAGAIIGGTNMKNQVEMLRSHRPQIVVATPGRLAELVFREEKLRLTAVRAVIVDEVDHLIRDTYVNELRTIIEATPLFTRNKHPLIASTSEHAPLNNQADEMIQADPQFVALVNQANKIKNPYQSRGVNARSPTMLCFASATAKGNPSVVNFANEYSFSESGQRGEDVGWHPIMVENASPLPATITHGIISCSRVKSFELLRKVLHAKPIINRALIFVNDPHRVEFVCERLNEMGIIAAPLHGDSSKDDRKEVLARIRDGRLKLIVATEMAARGLDIPDISHVINFELPTDSEHYIHRAGRCGRIGKPGLVINFCTPKTKFVIRRFAKQLRTKIFDCEIREGKIFLKKY